MSSASGALQSSKPRIAIVGAGIAGLALACLLRAAAFQCKVIEARPLQKTGHSYGIHLKRPSDLLAPKHSISNKPSINSQALDGLQAATDQALRTQEQRIPSEDGSFFASDRDVRQYLANKLKQQGVEISWETKVSSVIEANGTTELEVLFENGQKAHFDVVVNASGLRTPVGKTVKPILLPYCTYNGSRRVSHDEWNERWQPYFGKQASFEILSTGEGAPYFTVQRIIPNEVSRPVEVRWTYSRPAEDDDDPLYRPKRTPEESKDIPQAFYDEFAQAVPSILRSQAATDATTLLDAFTIEKVKKDRILHWHLRVQPNFVTYSADDAIINIGDAAHGLPILRSYGAQVAMRDAVRIAERLLQEKDTTTNDARFGADLKSDIAVYWHDTISSVCRLRRVHGQPELSHAGLEGLLGMSVPDHADTTRKKHVAKF